MRDKVIAVETSSENESGYPRSVTIERRFHNIGTLYKIILNMEKPPEKRSTILEYEVIYDNFMYIYIIEKSDDKYHEDLHYVNKHDVHESITDIFRKKFDPSLFFNTSITETYVVNKPTEEELKKLVDASEFFNKYNEYTKDYEHLQWYYDRFQHKFSLFYELLNNPENKELLDELIEHNIIDTDELKKMEKSFIKKEE